MKQSLRLGTVSGIPVGLHWGLLAIAGLYVISLATQVFPSAVPDASAGAHWLAATGAVVLFFLSVLAHELGHALVAQREGVRVRSITLWLLGGVAELQDEASTAGAEFRIAAAGPAVSLLLGGFFYGSALALATLFGGGLVPTTLGWLGIINGILAVFNLVPAAPLDGGRILSAAIWKRTGSPHTGRAGAARAGQVFGAIMVGLGSLTLLTSGNIFILILGWFLLAAASAERQRAQLFEVAEDVSVRDVMAPLASPTEGAVTLAGLHAMSGDATDVAFPVRGSSGTVIGIVPGSGLERLARGRQATQRADIAMIDWSQFVSARTSEPLGNVLQRFRDANTMHAVVYDDLDRQVGYLGIHQLMRARAAARTPNEPVNA